VGRPGLDPGTLGLKVSSGGFHGSPPFTDIGVDQHIYFHGTPPFAEKHRDF